MCSSEWTSAQAVLAGLYDKAARLCLHRSEGQVVVPVLTSVLLHLLLYQLHGSLERVDAANVRAVEEGRGPDFLLVRIYFADKHFLGGDTHPYTQKQKLGYTGCTTIFFGGYALAEILAWPLTQKVGAGMCDPLPCHSAAAEGCRGHLFCLDDD